MPDVDRFQLALGLGEPWEVVETKFDPAARRLDLRIDFRNSGFALFGCWGLTGSGHRGDGVWRLGQGLGC